MNIFKKVFIFYFIVFSIASTVILVVVFQSNSNFLDNINSINVANELFSTMTIIGITFRMYVNMANGVEQNYTSVVSDRFQYVQDILRWSSEKTRTETNNLRSYVSKTKYRDIQTAFKAPVTLIYDLSEFSEIETRNISIDQSLMLLFAKVEQFTEGISTKDLVKSNNPI